MKSPFGESMRKKIDLDSIPELGLESSKGFPVIKQNQNSTFMSGQKSPRATSQDLDIGNDVASV